jgi:hypothetical protein
MYDIDPTDLLTGRIRNAQAHADSFNERFLGCEDEPYISAYATLGVPYSYSCCTPQSGYSDLISYRGNVPDPNGAAWMDNTTLATASVLLSEEGRQVITPLTLWDLSTFIQASVCHDRIYHHTHSNVDDERINSLLGDTVLTSVRPPTEALPPGVDTRAFFAWAEHVPEPWEGAHRYVCELWREAHEWLWRLHESRDAMTLDGRALRAVADSWRSALGRPDLMGVDHSVRSWRAGWFRAAGRSALLAPGR